MSDAYTEILTREIGPDIERGLTGKLREVTAAMCRLSMGELLMLAEREEAYRAGTGGRCVVRPVWERRRDWAAYLEVAGVLNGLHARIVEEKGGGAR